MSTDTDTRPTCSAAQSAVQQRITDQGLGAEFLPTEWFRWMNENPERTSIVTSWRVIEDWTAEKVADIVWVCSASAERRWTFELHYRGNRFIVNSADTNALDRIDAILAGVKGA